MGGTPATSGTVTASPCTSDTFLYELEPGLAHGAGTGVEADLYVQRSTAGARTRSVIQWDLSGTVAPTNTSTVTVSNATIDLYSKVATGSWTLEIRHYNQDTSVEAATWNDGLKDGQVAPPLASFTFTAAVGIITIPNSAELDAVIQESLRNHGSIVTIVIQHTADDTIGALTARFAALEDPTNQEPRLSFDWSVPSSGDSAAGVPRGRDRSRGRAA